MNETERQPESDADREDEFDLGLDNETVDYDLPSTSEAAWHGATLALAEFARRGLVEREVMEEVMRCLSRVCFLHPCPVVVPIQPKNLAKGMLTLLLFLFHRHLNSPCENHRQHLVHQFATAPVTLSGHSSDPPLPPPPDSIYQIMPVR